jgi:hypothetical protein
MQEAGQSMLRARTAAAASAGTNAVMRWKMEAFAGKNYSEEWWGVTESNRRPAD